MAFRYRKNLANDSILPCKDYPLAADYAATAKPGDVVKLVAGELALAATGDTAVLGVLDGVSFDGLGVTPKVGKVRVAPTAVYEADFVGAGALTVGTEYGIDGASRIDTADVTTKVVKIVEVVNGKPYVVISARQIV